jgi:hypothetical protein
LTAYFADPASQYFCEWQPKKGLSSVITKASATVKASLSWWAGPEECEKLADTFHVAEAVVQHWCWFSCLIMG